MEQRKYAFVLMGEEFDPARHQFRFATERGETCLFTVRNFDEACRLAQRLQQEGFGALELCGAFGEEKCRELIERTGNRMAIGFSVHLPFQDGLFDAFFGA